MASPKRSVSPSRPHDSLFKASASSASSLMALQLSSRLFTFVLNQALLRMASPRAFGTAAIQFELMLSTILFLSREGVRNALLRNRKNSASSTNLSFLPLFIGLPLTFVTSYLYRRYAGSEARTLPHFEMAIGVYALAALTELLSEPMHNRAMAELGTTVRVRAEGSGIISKSIVTFLVLLYDARSGNGPGELAILAFATGQLAYALVVLVIYLAYYRRLHLWSRSPFQKASSTAFVDPYLLQLSLAMTSQSVIKHFLTEGDKIVLSWFSPLQDQGGYAIAVNYGSLVARIVFQPIEETSRVFFSKLLVGERRGSSSPDANLQALQDAARVLLSLLSVQVSFSIILIVFGTRYMPILWPILLPRPYLSTSAPQVLAAWVWYIPALAVNGLLEAFLSSVATSQDFHKQSRWMAVFSLIYTLTAIALYRLSFGDASLVYANIINLSIRIVYSSHCISSFFASQHAGDKLSWKEVMPSRGVCLASAVSAALIRLSEQTFVLVGAINKGGVTALPGSSVVVHVTLGAVLGLICMAVWWMSSGRFLSIPGRAKTE